MDHDNKTKGSKSTGQNPPPTDQNPQPGGATPPAQTGAQQGGAYPPGAYPPGGYPPPGYYPPPGDYYPPAGGMPPGGYPPGGAYPPGGYPPPPPGGYYPPAGGMPPGGYPPAGAYPPGDYPPPGGYPPQTPEDTTPANFQLGTKFPPRLKVKAPKHNLKFDEEYFIRILAGSISLSKDEKKKIVESIPKLKQAQIDELIRIFEEEKQKFAALSRKHVAQLEKLAEQHYQEWMDLEREFEQGQRKDEDQSKADEIRKNLGI